LTITATPFRLSFSDNNTLITPLFSLSFHYVFSLLPTFTPYYQYVFTGRFAGFDTLVISSILASSLIAFSQLFSIIIFHNNDATICCHYAMIFIFDFHYFHITFIVAAVATPIEAIAITPLALRHAIDIFAFRHASH
jgi:hypothetical protein